MRPAAHYTRSDGGARRAAPRRAHVRERSQAGPHQPLVSWPYVYSLARDRGTRAALADCRWSISTSCTSNLARSVVNEGRRHFTACQRRPCAEEGGSLVLGGCAPSPERRGSAAGAERTPLTLKPAAATGAPAASTTILHCPTPSVDRARRPRATRICLSTGRRVGDKGLFPSSSSCCLDVSSLGLAPLVCHANATRDHTAANIGRELTQPRADTPPAGQLTDLRLCGRPAITRISTTAAARHITMNPRARRKPGRSASAAC
jgi:hypothetical protein